MEKKLTDEEKKVVEKIVKLSKEGLNEEEIIEQIKEDFPHTMDTFGTIKDKIRIQKVIKDHTL